jgi:hypothetical protein
MISDPQEEARLQGYQEFLLGRICKMEEAVQACGGDLVFRLTDGQSWGLGMERH